MEKSEIFFFLAGLAAALGFSIFTIILIGLKLKLYLINIESAQPEQSIIPITAELKKRSWLKTILSGNWKENLEITLKDYQNRTFTFQVGFHLLGRFNLSLLSQEGHSALLNQKTMLPNRRYFLKNGMRLETGDRAFEILITAAPVEQIASEQPY